MTTPQTTTTTAHKLSTAALIIAAIAFVLLVGLLLSGSVVSPLIGVIAGYGSVVVSTIAVIVALAAWVVGKRFTLRIALALLLAIVPPLATVIYVTTRPL